MVAVADSCPGVAGVDTRAGVEVGTGEMAGVGTWDCAVAAAVVVMGTPAPPREGVLAVDVVVESWAAAEVGNVVTLRGRVGFGASEGLVDVGGDAW